MKRPLQLALLAVAMSAALTLSFHGARANDGTPPGGPMWAATLGTNQSLGPAANWDFNPAGPMHYYATFFTSGGNLYGLQGEGAPAGGTTINRGTAATTWNLIPSNAGGTACTCPGGLTTCCQNFGTNDGIASVVNHVTSPVTLSDGSGTFIFVANENGKLYKVNANNGQLAGSVNLHRTVTGPLLCTNDKLKSTPLVQLAQFSSQNFKNVYCNVDPGGGNCSPATNLRDIVYVATSYDSTSANACKTTSANEIIAIDATSMTIRWRFGGPATTSFGEFLEGCDIDYNTDIIYCAARQPAGGIQMTLVALQTYDPSQPNQLARRVAVQKWAKNAGDLQTRPFLHAGKVFVATGSTVGMSAAGTIKAYDAALGTSKWSTPTNCTTTLDPNGCNIVHNFWVEDRVGYAGTILATTVDGRVHGLLDTVCTGTPCGSESWMQAVNAKTQIVTDPGLNKIYVGCDTSSATASCAIKQFNMLTGDIDGTLTLAGTSNLVGDPSLDAVSGGIGIDRISLGAGSSSAAVAATFKRYCIPMAPGTNAAEPDPAGGSQNGSRQRPPPEVVGSNCDPTNPTSCSGYDVSTQNNIIANPTCIVRTCDPQLRICYFKRINGGASCDDGQNASTTSQCIDGICFGPANNTGAGLTKCSVEAFGEDCISPQGVKGQCCGAGAAPNCFATGSDVAHCGGCFTACSGENNACINGICCHTCTALPVNGCPAGQDPTTCCADLSSDENNCGACGTRCTATSPVCCNRGCVNLTSDSNNCGVCGNACRFPTGAPEPCCNSTCTDTTIDKNNCGTCGHQCTGVTPGCCASTCFDFSNNNSHCGNCNTVCNPPQTTCQSGQCKCSCGSCGPGLQCVGGTCIGCPTGGCAC